MRFTDLRWIQGISGFLFPQQSSKCGLVGTGRRAGSESFACVV